MDALDPQLVDEACYPFTRPHRWFARAQCLLFLTIPFLFVYPPDNQTLLILTGFVSFLAIGSESIFWYVRRTCTEILVDGKWSHGVVTARRTTPRGPVHRITVSVEDNGQCYAREAIVPCKNYFRLRVGQAVQVLHDRQPGGRWVLIRDASAASQAAQ